MFEAKLNEFFLVTLPGLEDIAAAEVHDWYPDLETKNEHGGVIVFAPLGVGLSMNQVLKTPTRILLRLANFRAKDFPKLYNKILDFSWKDWVDPSCALEAHVSTRLSRLKIKNRIRETCESAWKDYQKSLKISPRPNKKLDLYVRFHEDDCQLSLDTSGERLHKRGERTLIGEAPLRETIAASLIQMVGRLPEVSSLPVEVCDPMMGSGTFLLEAGRRDRPVEARFFAFENFLEKVISPVGIAAERPSIVSLIGFEKDKKALAAAKANLTGLETHIFEQDFFMVSPLLKKEGLQRWVFANPPYGERLRIKTPLKEYYALLFQQVEKILQPDLSCFILPAKAVKGKFDLPKGWKVVEKRPFLNGGIPVVAFVFGRTSIDGRPALDPL